MGLLLYFVLLAQDAYRRHLACIYAPLPLLLSSQPTAGVFRAVVVANGVQKLSRDAMGPTFSEEDYDNITGLAGEGDLMEQLGASLAPSIHGHTVIKKGLVLLLATGGLGDTSNSMRSELPCYTAAVRSLGFWAPEIPSA